jgi:hypothetical protein
VSASITLPRISPMLVYLLSVSLIGFPLRWSSDCEMEVCNWGMYNP